MGFNTPAYLQSLQTNLEMRFINALTAATPDSFYNRIATEIPSSSRANHYPLADRLPGQLRKWVGERVKQGANIFDYVIVNDKYEATISIEREDIEDSQLGLAQMSIDSIGYEAGIWPDKLLTSVLEAGATNTTYDGAAFFSDQHPVNAGIAGGSVQANLFSSATAAGARVLTAPNFAYVLSAWRGLKGVDGSPMGMGQRPTLMVPTALEWTAKTILNTGIIAPTVAIAGNANNIAVSNVFQGAADLIVNPWLTSATAWYLLDVARPIRPFIFQRRTGPEFTWLNQTNDANVFWQDQYSYGVRLRGNAGYGLWFMACKADA